VATELCVGARACVQARTIFKAAVGELKKQIGDFAVVFDGQKNAFSPDRAKLGAWRDGGRPQTHTHTHTPPRPL
jgi:hypothetical protein